MVPGAFSLIFDHEQTRVARHPIIATINGLGWNGGIYADTWIDPITHTLMLRPMSKYPMWQVESGGIFSKPSSGSYEFETSGNWQEFERYVNGGSSFMQGAATGNPGWIRTATAPGLNRGINLAIFGYGAGEFAEIAQFGWDDSSVSYDSSAVGCRLFSDGSVYIYRDGEYAGSGKIGIGASGANNLPLEILLLPMRRRELLVLGSGNDGFSLVFDSIEEGEVAPVIVPAEKFWVKMSGAETTRAQVQICPCKFEGSGFANSVLINFQRPPASGATLRAWGNPVFSATDANLYGNTAFAGSTDVPSVELVEADGSTAFIADGSLAQGRMRATLEGDGAYTPFVYGAVTMFEGETALTDGSEEANADDKIASLVIEVPDDPWGARVVATFREPDAINAEIAKFTTVSNRPAKLVCNDYVLFDGRTAEPDFTDGVHDEAKTVKVEILDLTDRFKAFQFRDEFPLDGFYLSRDTGVGHSAVLEIATQSGVGSGYLALSTDTYLIPEIPGQICEEFSYPAKVGDDGQQGLENLHQNFAANWFIGMKPTPSGMKFHFMSPDDLGTTPKCTLYRTVEDAISAGAHPSQVYQSHRSETEKVNANEIWVSGLDSRTKKLVQAYLIDSASQDPTVSPSSRADNWLGEPLLYGVQDERFRSLDDCQRAVELLAPAVLVKRKFGEFACPEMVWYDSDGEGLMLPLWRGDYVTLDGVGDVQINAFNAGVLLNIVGEEDDPDNVVTYANYTFGGLTNAGGRSLAEVQESNKARYDAANRAPILKFGGVWRELARRQVS